MTNDQQHHIRNGLLCIMGIMKRLEATELSEDQVLLVVEMRKQVRRIGAAAGINSSSVPGPDQ